MSVLLNHHSLKRYSVILTTSFYEMNQKIKTKKAFFPKFQSIPILRFQVKYDYVCFIASINFCIELVSSTRFSVKIALISYWHDFSLIPLGNVLLRGELRKDATNSNFENFESTLYSKSGSMPPLSQSNLKFPSCQTAINLLLIDTCRHPLNYTSYRVNVSEIPVNRTNKIHLSCFAPHIQAI